MFTSFIATVRFAKTFGPAAPDPAVVAWLKGRIDAACAVVDKHLAERDFPAGGGVSIAGVSLSGEVAQSG